MNYENDLQHECPIIPTVGQFWIKLTKAIPGRLHLRPGEFLLIDPLAEPKQGQLVLSGDVIEPYTNQGSIEGMAVQVWGEVN